MRPILIVNLVTLLKENYFLFVIFVFVFRFANVFVFADLMQLLLDHKSMVLGTLSFNTITNNNKSLKFNELLYAIYRKLSYVDKNDNFVLGMHMSYIAKDV